MGSGGKADGFFEDVLNQEATCADAYEGKLLAANSVSSLSAYFDKLENKYATATSETLFACPEGREHINRSARNNSLEGYLKSDEVMRLYVYDRRYGSTLSCRKQQREAQLSEIESDKLLSRVRQYATGDLQNEVESRVSHIKAVLDERVSEAQREDETRINEITTQNQAFIETADAKAKELRSKADQKKQAYYEKCVEEMNAATTISQYEQVQSKN